MTPEVCSEIDGVASKANRTEQKFSKDYDWNEDDPTILPGWKSTTIQMNSFGKIVESNRYMAPDGRYCSNRLDALRYMTKEGIFTQEDIQTMKEGLTEDGWKADPGLPTGWYMKPRKDKVNEATASYHYVSDTFQNFESTKSAIKYMIESLLKEGCKKAGGQNCPRSKETLSRQV